MCVESAVQSTSEFQLLIVDDCSSATEREVADEFIAKYRNISIISNSGRRGFGGACNFGAEHCQTDFIIFLNTDCLLSPNTISQIVDVLVVDKSVGLVSTLTNKSVETQFPIFTGLSFLDMASLLERCSERAGQERYVDCRTAEGHCFAVRRTLFLELGGFLPKWGIGYGEETDLHFRAVARGHRSVVSLCTYVYHQGGQSFQSTSAYSELKKRNHALFLSQWGDAYRSSVALDRSGPRAAERNVSLCIGDLRHVFYDVLFVLPGITQGVGGIQSVIDVINCLLLRGVRAGLVTLLATDLHDSEALFFRPINGQTDDVLRLVSATLVISTHHETISLADRIAKHSSGRHVNYVQGLETLFSDGLEAPKTVERLKLVDDFIVNSSWTSRHITPFIRSSSSVTLGYPIIPFGLFLNRQRRRYFDVAFFLRSAPAKGQARLLDLVYRLASSIPKLKIAIIAAPRFYSALETDLMMADVHAFPPDVGLKASDWSTASVSNCELYFIRAPLSRSQIASVFDHSRLYVDTSDHEGFGLVAAEAALSGTLPICLDSGGFTGDFRYAGVVIPPGADAQDVLSESVMLNVGKTYETKFDYPHFALVDLIQSKIFIRKTKEPLLFASATSRAKTQALAGPQPGTVRARVKFARATWKRLPNFIRRHLKYLAFVIGKLSDE